MRNVASKHVQNEEVAADAAKTPADQSNKWGSLPALNLIDNQDEAKSNEEAEQNGDEGLQEVSEREMEFCPLDCRPDGFQGQGQGHGRAWYSRIHVQCQVHFFLPWQMDMFGFSLPNYFMGRVTFNNFKVKVKVNTFSFVFTSRCFE